MLARRLDVSGSSLRSRLVGSIALHWVLPMLGFYDIDKSRPSRGSRRLSHRGPRRCRGRRQLPAPGFHRAFGSRRHSDTAQSGAAASLFGDVGTSCSPGCPDVPAGRPGHQAAADIITPSLSPIRRSRCHCLLDTPPASGEAMIALGGFLPVHFRAGNADTGHSAQGRD
jgi:hypothetical protein